MDYILEPLREYIHNRADRPIFNMANPMKGLAQDSHLLVTVVFSTLLQGISFNDQTNDWAVLSAPQSGRAIEGKEWLRLDSLNLRLNSLKHSCPSLARSDCGADNIAQSIVCLIAQGYALQESGKNHCHQNM